MGKSDFSDEGAALILVGRQLHILSDFKTHFSSEIASATEDQVLGLAMQALESAADRLRAVYDSLQPNRDSSKRFLSGLRESDGVTDEQVHEVESFLAI